MTTRTGTGPYVRNCALGGRLAEQATHAKQARRACIATKTHMQTGTRETRARGEVGGWTRRTKLLAVLLSRCQSKGAQGTGRGCTNRSGSRWGAGRLQVDSRRRDVESGCRRQQIEDNARGRGRRLGGLLCFCKRGGHTLGGRACPRRPAVTGVPPSESEVQGHRGEEVCRWERLLRRMDV